MNRQLTARLADYHFAPTEAARDNLLGERIADASILVTGNTVIDALLANVARIRQMTDEPIGELTKLLDPARELILVTGHRRENQGEGFQNICAALQAIAAQANVQIIYPVHPNPNVRQPIYDNLGDTPNIILVDPLPYHAFIWLMDRSKLILTDSGGIQEEAPALGKPVLVLRDTTERPEAVAAGTVIMVGTSRERIIATTLALLGDEPRYQAMTRCYNPYGDGKAAARIVDFIKALPVGSEKLSEGESGE
jgi:UDP-N-acetylglucosamine 2-epimerase (non-hydrolysing)